MASKVTSWGANFAVYELSDGGSLCFARHHSKGYFCYRANPGKKDFHFVIPPSCETVRRLIDGVLADRDSVPTYVLADAILDFLPNDSNAVAASELLQKQVV